MKHATVILSSHFAATTLTMHCDRGLVNTRLYVLMYQNLRRPAGDSFCYDVHASSAAFCGYAVIEERSYK
jgi:hypothetical protein